MYQTSRTSDLRRFILQKRVEGKSVGLVPTMGALHSGHLALVETARSENDIVVCSIFVNPTQFNNPEDLAKYPRTVEADCAMLASAGCDVAFVPTVEEMYPTQPDLSFDFGIIERVMEGAFRPGHFNGVGIVVSKLFNLVQPDRAYFGQKDLQQTAVIKSLVRSLSFPITLRICPTVREADGLAMSSRNVRLTSDERALAPQINSILTFCSNLLKQGESVESALSMAEQAFSSVPEFRLEYLQFVDATTLQPLSEVTEEGNNALCTAVHLGSVRLIDNLVF